MGIDPVPGRVGYPSRMLLVVLTLPFHAFLGVTIMGQTALIGGDWYPALHDGPMGAWLPDPHDDQHLAGGILWGSGDLIGLVFFAVLFAQWVRSSMREAEREDRRLDLLEARRPDRPIARPRRTGPATTGSIAAVNDSTSARTAPLKVLVYSDDVNTRQQVILALGRRPHPDLPELEYVEVATEPVVIQNMDAGQIDLAILDGEAVPAGGLGIAKQLKDEIYRLPAGAGAHRAPAGRLAGHLVARRGRRPAPARPDPAGRDRRRAAALARARHDLRAPDDPQLAERPRRRSSPAPT